MQESEGLSAAFQMATGMQRTGDAPVIYVNSAQVRVTPYDFQLLLGQTTEPGPGNTIVVNNLVTVVMSPQHAKALADILSRHVQAFEILMGQIQVGPREGATMPGSSVPGRPSSRSRGAARKKA